MVTKADYLLAVFIYVAFRSSQPDFATVWYALKELRDNNIDVRQLANWSSKHCAMQNFEEKEEIPHRDTGAGN